MQEGSLTGWSPDQMQHHSLEIKKVTFFNHWLRFGAVMDSVDLFPPFKYDDALSPRAVSELKKSKF